MRKIDQIIIHCTATFAGYDLKPETLRKWHVVDNGWDDCGYHYYIDRWARVHAMRPVEKEGAHCLGHNAHSVGVAMAGGINKLGDGESNFTFAQFNILNFLVRSLAKKFDATIHGHTEFATYKACPSFNVAEFFKDDQIKAETYP